MSSTSQKKLQKFHFFNDLPTECATNTLSHVETSELIISLNNNT